MNPPSDLPTLLGQIRACRICEAHLPLGPNPVLQAASTSRLLIVGQAPGKGQSGDLPPRPECAQHWHESLLRLLPQVRLTLLVGRFAQAYFLQERNQPTLTQTVAHWPGYLPQFMPLPHPSPRNGFWLRRNPWFEEEAIPVLQLTVQEALK